MGKVVAAVARPRRTAGKLKKEPKSKLNKLGLAQAMECICKRTKRRRQTLKKWVRRILYTQAEKKTVKANGSGLCFQKPTLMIFSVCLASVQQRIWLETGIADRLVAQFLNRPWCTQPVHFHCRSSSSETAETTRISPLLLLVLLVLRTANRLATPR